jgi:lipid-binding SYLF domain-containing protein
LYAGVSLDGSVILSRPDVNYRFYGRAVSPLEVLGGQVPPPRAAQPLYDALQAAMNSSLRPRYPHRSS